MKRDGDFSKNIKRVLFERVNGLCSICGCTSSGPHNDPTKSTLNGEAAHIHAASPGGPRFNPDLSLEDIRSPKNGIWLCASCHKIVDRNDSQYSAQHLYQFKKQAEYKAESSQLEKKILSYTETPKLKEKWVHETTDDVHYVPRKDLLTKLDSWICDTKNKVITITGIGGQGKTSLVGNWLSNKKPLTARGIQGLFYWSFYNETDVNVFFKELILFCRQNFTISSKYFEDMEEPSDVLRDILSNISICVVLDGLEVIQSDKSERQKGQFVSADLRHLLFDLSFSITKSIAVLTSRFDIVDLKPCKQVVKTLRLGKLNEQEACALLRNQFVGGPETDLCRISNALEGHPLALRVFAAGLPKEHQMNPISHLNRVLSIESLPQNSLDGKINRLLNCYEDTLTPEQISVLCSVSVLHKVIDEESLIKMCNKQIPTQDQSLIERSLLSLVITGLVIRDVIGHKAKYSCHPIVRDYFRSKITSDSDRGNLIGEYLASRPGRNEVTDTETLEYLVSAIEIFASSGSWIDASEIYESKLMGGMVFKKLSSPDAGWRCTRALTQSAPKNPALYSGFFDDNDKFNTLVVYLNSAGQFSKDMGDYDNALSCYQDAIKILSKNSQLRNKSTILLGLSQVYIELGDIDKAINHLSESMDCASERDISDELSFRLHLARAQIHLLCGENLQAEKRLANILKKTAPHPRAKYKKSKHPGFRALAFMGLIEIAISTGQFEYAEGLQSSSIPYINQADRLDLMMMSMYWQGSVFSKKGDIKQAEASLLIAERLARKANMEYWLTRINLLQAEILYSNSDIQNALLLIDNCINVANSRQFETLLVDSLILKAIMTHEDQHQVAEELLYDAEHTAQQLGYTRALKLLA